MNSNVLPLHISDTIYSLEKIAAQPVGNVGFSMCINQIYELYDKVIEAYKSMDEEAEYLHIRKCLVLLKHAKTFKEFKKLPRNKVLKKYESLLIPRLDELKKSLEQRYKYKNEEIAGDSGTDKSLSTLLNWAEIKTTDPELGAFVKAADETEADPKRHLKNIGAQNTPYGDSLFSGTPTTNMSIHKPLYLAKTIGNLEYLSRQIPVPDLEFEEFIKRMAHILKLRKTIKCNDLEMDFILLSRYLSFNEKIRKLTEYHANYATNRHLLSKVVTIKSEYEEVKKLLISKYTSFSHAMKLIQHLTLKEKMMEAEVQGIKNRKAAWKVLIKDGMRQK